VIDLVYLRPSDSEFPSPAIYNVMPIARYASSGNLQFRLAGGAGFLSDLLGRSSGEYAPVLNKGSALTMTGVKRGRYDKAVISRVPLTNVDMLLPRYCKKKYEYNHFKKIELEYLSINLI
jgi:hypothetical protein